MIDLSEVEHHPAIEEIVTVLCNKTQNTDRAFFRILTAYHLGKMASVMRANILTKNRGEIPVNVYALALATSGYGKGHSIGLLEDHFMKGFERRFMDDTFDVIAEKSMWDVANKRAAKNGTEPQEEFDKAVKDSRSAGPFLFTFDSGTSPAVKQLRNRLLLSNIGSFNLQIDEIGLNLLGNTELLTLYLELYDQGKVKQKLTKETNDNKRSEDLDGKTPANMLLFGAPSKLLDGGATEDNFYSMLDTGYARRCLFTHGQNKRKAYHSMTAEEIYKAGSKTDDLSIIHKWRTHFHRLADPALHGWTMTLPDDVAVVWIQYQIDCELAAEKMPEHDEIRRAEMAHRYFKAIKLAGALAYVDESSEVELEHLLAAIKLTEESGAAFQSILKRERAYVKLARFIGGSGTELTHADLSEELPFYKGSNAIRSDMLTMASSWGVKNNILIKKSFVDGIEFIRGEALKETDLNEMIFSYGGHFAYHYLSERVPFEELHNLTQAEGMHWVNHHLKGGYGGEGHRSDETVLPGFNAIVIDVDEGVPLSVAHELLNDYKFMTYTTKRHTPDLNRFRLIIPIAYELELDQADYREFMNNVMGWLPFASDEAANQRAKKWESFSGGAYHYNLDGETLDPLQFIPKTTKNDQYKSSIQKLDSLDNLERWFAQRIANGNRNTHLIKFALALVDSGMDLINVSAHVHAFNKKLNNPLSEDEIDQTILVTVAKRIQRAAAA